LNGKGENKIALQIANTFSVPVTSVVQLRNQNWGFGEIYRLYELSKLSGKTPDQIQALRDSGIGWGQIATKLGVKPGHGSDNLGSIVSGGSDQHGNSNNSQHGSNGNADQNKQHGKRP
jgi:hypothetical protein